jgi:hypothetical protein
LIGGAEVDLVIASFVVETDKEEAAGGVAEVVNGVIAVRNRVFKFKGDGVKTAVRYTHTRNDVFNISDMLLMRLDGKDNGLAPRAITGANPPVMEEHIKIWAMMMVPSWGP